MTGESDANKYRGENLDIIYKSDPKIFERMTMLSGGGTINALTAQKVARVLTATRVLDEPPKSLKLQTKGGYPSGIKSVLQYAINTIDVGDSSEPGYVKFGPAELRCEISVIRVIKALLVVGKSRNPEITEAVKEIVFNIIKIGSGGLEITPDLVVERLSPSGYYQEEIVAGIKSIFNGEDDE